ncbi:MAG: DHA2 family efflux MFS transporter permease subunit [Alphaproteobacteria bacterium]
MAEQPIATTITPARRAVIMGCVMMATMIFVMNQTNVIVALPHMQGTFSATQDQIAWVLTSFIVALTIMTASTGWLSARLGRKRLYLVALGGFTVTSFLCATASSLEAEVGFRALQGALGAPIIPLSQAIVLDAYPKERHGAALGLWGIGITVGPVFGPIVGGYATEMGNWPWVFWFNVPVGAVILIGILLSVPDAAPDRTRKLDWAGFATLALALAAVQFVLNRGERLDWFASSEIIIAFALFLLGTYVFVVHSMTTAEPFVPRALVRDRNVMLGYLLIFLWGTVLHSPLVLLSLRLQGLENYPVIATGMLMAPRGVGGVLAMALVGRSLRRINARHLFGFGLLCVASATWYMSNWPTQALDRDVMITAFVFGFGIAFAWVPLSMLTLSTIDTRHRTEGVVFFNLILNMGTGVGITLAVLVFTKSIQINHEALTAFVTPYNKVFNDALLPSLWGLGRRSSLPLLDSEIGRQAMTIAFNNSFLLIALVALAAIPLVYGFRRPRRANSPEAGRPAPTRAEPVRVPLPRPAGRTR